MKLNRYKVIEHMARQRITRQRELASLVGVSAQALSGWLHDDPPSLENVGALCRVLRCTPNDILDLETFSPEPKNKRRELVPA